MANAEIPPLAAATRAVVRVDAQGIDFRPALDASREAIDALLAEGSSANTKRSYRAAIHYWAAWHVVRLQEPFALPLSAATVLQFIADHVQHATAEGWVHDLPKGVDAALVAMGVKGKLGAYSMNTTMHRLAVLSEAHEAKDMENPCRARSVRLVLERARSAYAKRGAGPQKKDAITRDVLERLLETCDDSLIGVRDRALLLFAWASGGRRRSEVVGATMENVRRVPEGFLYTLGVSKTNQTGDDLAGNHKPVVGRAAQALDAWLTASGITSGAIFRRVRRGGVVGPALGAGAVRKMVIARAELAGLEGDFSAHSLRSGFVTESGRQNVALGETMALTGHASVASVVGYHRAGNVLAMRSGRLLDVEPDSAGPAQAPDLPKASEDHS